MIFRTVALLLLLTLGNSLFAEEETSPAPTPKPGIVHRVINFFHKDKTKAASKETKDGKRLDLAMTISPQPLKLSDTHEISVTLTLTNNTDKLTQLDFPTTQRVEVLLRNEAGKMVTQWSENQSFSNDPGYVTINPREHVEYTVSISGRDMVAGKTYTIEGFLPNYDKLRVTKTIIPER